jgi:hypothetical protein
MAIRIEIFKNRIKNRIKNRRIFSIIDMINKKKNEANHNYFQDEI